MSEPLSPLQTSPSKVYFLLKLASRVPTAPSISLLALPGGKLEARSWRRRKAHLPPAGFTSLSCPPGAPLTSAWQAVLEGALDFAPSVSQGQGRCVPWDLAPASPASLCGVCPPASPSLSEWDPSPYWLTPPQRSEGWICGSPPSKSKFQKF